MTFQEFTARITEAVSELNSNAEISVQKVTKDNGITRFGMTITEEGEDKRTTVSPIVYLEPYYEKAEEGVPINQLARMLSETYSTARWAGERLDTSRFLSYEEAKDRVFCRLTGKEKNAERLAHMPHEDWQDLAVTYYVDVPSFGGESTSIVQVTDSLLSHWKIPESRLRADAWKNTQVQKPLFIEPLGSMLYNMMGLTDGPGADSPLYLLGTPEAEFGAICAAYPDLPEIAGALFDKNFFMLPSSVHEFLLLPDDGSISAASLESMVRTINGTEVSEQDVLSDRVYYCDAKTKEISLATEYEQKHKERSFEKEPMPALYAAPGL